MISGVATRNPKFIFIGISLGVEYMKQAKYISGDERRRCEVMFLFPTWG
jgi:hypothetical protein